MLCAPSQRVFDFLLESFASQCEVAIRRRANLVHRLGFKVRLEERTVSIPSLSIVTSQAQIFGMRRDQTVTLAVPIGMIARPAVVLWPVDHRNYSPLDDWAEHIAYLRLTCGCKDVSRVAKFGDAITPLRFHENVREFGSWRELVYANVKAVREAVAFLAANVPEDARTSDPAARVVYGLLAGTLAPEQAIAQIRAMREGRHG